MTFLGGIGLFLLGMRLMSDGLRVAAGPTLREILAASTASRLRGLLSGVLITCAVQSSSAVIFATIGFVNAGLLSLYQSLGVIYGANVGTTLTSWIVALIGVNVDLQALALPLIGAGVALRLLGQVGRRQALGDAIAGLGVFFLGLDILQATFTGIGDPEQLAAVSALGHAGLILFVGAGIILTTLTQSSSAALAVTLTAAAGGLISMPAAAAMLIGANVGTTSTALFAALGATANAQRAAVAHVLFNVVAGSVAFLALPLLLGVAQGGAAAIGLGGQPAAALAVFHTLSKLLGVAILWPLTGHLVRWLEQRFRRGEDDRGTLHYLDANVLTTPSLALEAARREAERSGAMARAMVCAAISSGDSTTPAGTGRRRGQAPVPQSWFEREHATLERLIVALIERTHQIERAQHDASISASLPHLLRVTQYHQDMAERACTIAELLRSGQTQIADRQLAADFERLLARAAGWVQASGQDPEQWDETALELTLEELEESYQALKSRLLQAGAQGQLPVRQLVATLDCISAVRRVVDQSLKAAYYLRHFQQPLSQSLSQPLSPPA
nr:Na/Pi symporter [Halorhodospira abdelmalekii]